MSIGGSLVYLLGCLTTRWKAQSPMLAVYQQASLSKMPNTYLLINGMLFKALYFAKSICQMTT